MLDILKYVRKYTPFDKPCTCSQYPFPHRLGSGYCRADRICQHDQDLDEGRCEICDRADEIHDGRCDK